MLRLAAIVVCCSLLAGVGCGDNSAGKPTSTAIETPASTAPGTPGPTAHIPDIAPSSDIKLPAGFAAYPIATGFLRATSVAPAPDGSIYVSDQEGNVYRLVDANGDGVFEGSSLFTFGAKTITGIMVGPDGTLYVSSRGKIDTVRDINGDGQSDEVKDIITGLPNGRHQNNGLAIGPDGKLYITNGSTCDDCLEQDERSATILQSNLDGSGLLVYAKGLRNPYDIAFDSKGQLWATDNGSDSPCGTTDELNLIVDGGDYGWPYGNDGCDNTTDGTPPVASLGLHTASTGVTFYGGSAFPAEYKGNLFATLWGNGFGPADPANYAHVLVRAQEADGTDSVNVFGSGFKHPIDVFADGDGSLLVLDYGSDDANKRDGTLYRIVYTGH